MDMLSAIIFINKDLTDQVKGVLQTQLYISQTMDFDTFNDIVDGYVADRLYRRLLWRTDSFIKKTHISNFTRYDRLY